VTVLILVVDDEPDVEMLFRQQFRRDLRVGRFIMEFAQSADAALQCITDARTASLIIDPVGHQHAGNDGPRIVAESQSGTSRCSGYHDGDAETKRKALEGGAEALFTKPIDFVMLRNEIDTRVAGAA
jgi:CheY-like chemotaxis protein